MTKLKIISLILVGYLIIQSCSKSGVIDNPDTKQYKEYAEDIQTPTQWWVTELIFTSDKIYDNGFNDVGLDVIFTHESGIQYKIPAFWDEKKIWKVRFSPTKIGKWKYITICSDTTNIGLNNQIGEIICKKYNGQKDLYKHGFIKTLPNQKHFMYDDGTPFFYLGDTHWGMESEPFETVFKKIVNKRVGQGFTVYQSEPISPKYNLSNGFSSEDLFGFKEFDKKFKYIAAVGLVHANSQLFFTSVLGHDMANYSDAYLEKLCRYWVARYGAYPVIWTTAQECDNDFYADRGDHSFYDATTNPWEKVATYVNKYDAYKHPLTAHMEYVSFTNASHSAFRDLESHTWFGAQWTPKKNGQIDFNIPKDFWQNGQGKPSINYEGAYDYFWTNHFGARMQAWIAYLNGMYGYGYGATDIWLYNNSTYNMDNPTVKDGITISVAMKQTDWSESVEFPTAYQMGYMRSFLESINWWALTPRFDDSNWFVADGNIATKGWYSLASNSNNLLVMYFYNPNKKTGTIKNLDNTNYSIQWFDPISGKYKSSSTVTIQDGTYTVGEKPTFKDWVFLMEKL